MNHSQLSTVLIGLGKVGAGYADDPVMARHIRYASHAQVLAAHPAYSWDAVVDCDSAACSAAHERWGVPIVARSTSDLPPKFAPDVAVLATPPSTRLELLHRLPSVRAVLVEKPLGRTVQEAEAFLDRCRKRNILVQVNLWRRADALFRRLAAGHLEELVGRPQAVFGLFGNGLLNNGTHLVDFVRMLCGEIIHTRALPHRLPYAEGPIPGDIQMPLALHLSGDVTAMLHPVRFVHYREVSLDIWGEAGRLRIEQEGLRVVACPIHDNRSNQGAYEVASDCPRELTSTVGHAFYEMYDNLAQSLNAGAPLYSPGSSALQTARIIDRLLADATRGQDVLSKAA